MLMAFKAIFLMSSLIGGSPMVESDFSRRTGQSIHGAEQSILVVSYAPTELKWDNEVVDQELTRHVAEHLAANGIQTVDPESVQRWLAKNRNWKNAAEVGTAFDTDYVIFIEIKDYSLFEEHSSNLYRGRADLVVSVFQVDKSRDGGNVIYNKELVSRFPREAAISVYHQSYDAFKKLYLGTLSSQVAEMFCTPEPNAEACLPFISPEVQLTAAARGGIDAIVARQDFAAVVDEFNEALSQNRLDDALRLATKGKSLQPENPVAEVMILKSKFIISDAINRLVALAESGTEPVPAALVDAAADGDDKFEKIGCFGFELPKYNTHARGMLRKRFLALLEKAIERIGETRSMPESELQKLRLAGQGDIQAFYQQVEKVAPSLRALTSRKHPEFLFDLREEDPLFDEVVALHKQVSGDLFGAGSKFSKVNARILRSQGRQQ